MLFPKPHTPGLSRPWSQRLARHALGLGALLLAGCASLQPPAPTDVAAPQAAATAPTATANATPALSPIPTLPSLPRPGPQPGGIVPQTPLQAVAELPASAPWTVAPMEAPRELWDRIRRGFAMPALSGELVGVHERWYASRPDYMQRMTERSRKYLFHIVEELERRNMPTELALLPFIESAFNPQAVSSAKAAGMWQFMPATGRDFSLRQNAFRDDRRDVLASTRAALDYLQRLHQQFGDWHLALAAYNWGEGNVGRALARNKRAGLGKGYPDLSMPAETRNYVPKLQAVKNIVAAPERFNTELPLIENHPYFQEVEIARDIDVSLAARLADVQLEDFKALNPSIHRPVILAAGTGRILLPWDNAEVFKRNFEAYNAGQYASWTAWTVPSTMSVAEAAKRAGMSEADLRSVNNIPPRMLIKAGSALLVPRQGKRNEDVTSQVADNGTLGLAPEMVTRRTTVKARQGETVATIAKRFKLSPLQVADWNKVSAHASFKPGQSVVLYVQVKAGGGAKAASKAKPRKAVDAKPARKKPVKAA